MNIYIWGMLYHHKKQFLPRFSLLSSISRVLHTFPHSKITKIPPPQPLKKKNSYYIVIGKSHKMESFKSTLIHQTK